MPRLTNDKYYEEHQRLMVLWQRWPSTYTLLSVTQQWNVHRFYPPTHDLSRAELIAYRKAITKQQPSLPHKAGKAYELLFDRFKKAEAAKPITPLPKGRVKVTHQLRVRGLATWTP